MSTLFAKLAAKRKKEFKKENSTTCTAIAPNVGSYTTLAKKIVRFPRI